MRKILLGIIAILFATPSFAVDSDPCRNLFDGQWRNGIYNTTNGTATESENRISNRNAIAIKPNTQYTVSSVSAASSMNALRWLFYDENKNFISFINQGTTITSPENARYLNFYIANNFTTSNAPSDVQIEEGTTATEYVPYCSSPITIATTKYNETAFGPLNTALQNAISVVDTVVSNTITQAASIATLQAQKQTRPADDPSDANNAENCPAGQKCLLVEDATGVPHWYAIQESYLPLGYTPLKYIEFDDTQTLSIPFSGINSGDWEFYAKWMTLAAPTANYSCIFNVYKSEDAVTYRVIHVLKNVNEYFLTGNSRAGSGGFRTVLEANEIHTATVKTDHTVIADGNISRTTSTATNLPDTVNLTLCSGFKRYYEMRVTKNNVIQINLIPAKRNSDGTVGFYDTVSNTFQTATTGSFIAGPVAE